MRRTTRFDAVDYLDTEERQVAYITAALETGDADFVRDALSFVARARGMGEIAKSAGLNRESLYKALRETGNPEIQHRYAHRPCLGSDALCTPRVDRTNDQAAPGSLRPRRGLESSRAGNIEGRYNPRFTPTARVEFGERLSAHRVRRSNSRSVAERHCPLIRNLGIAK